MGKAEQVFPLTKKIDRPNRLPVLGRNQRDGVDRVAAPFLPDALEIEDRPLPFAARSTVYIVALLVIAALLWASLSRIDRVVVAHGKLVTVDPLMVVMPLEIAVIRTINVGVGDYVRAGEILATLDPTFTESAEVAHRDKLRALTAEAERLEAEINGREYHPATTDPNQTADIYANLQMRILRHRRAEFEAAKAASDADAAKLEASITTNRAAQAGIQERLKLSAQIENMRNETYTRAVGSMLNLLQAKLDRHQLEDQFTDKMNQERELTYQLASSRQQQEKYINNWVREAGERLSQVRADMVITRQQLATAERKKALVVLRAPADGVVLELGQRSIGSVAKEAESLVTLVPHDNRIEAQVEVDAVDIGRLRVGDPVRVKLDALPYQRYGSLTGTLRVVTENSFQPDKADARPDRTERSAFFRARVMLDPPTSLRNVPTDFRLIPGMTTTAEVNVGKRSVISYILNPIVRLFDEGLREP